MLIESLPIIAIHADPANARVHSPKNLDAIKASLTRFGQQKPIVIDEKNIVRAGNGTLAAAKTLGWTHINIVRTLLAGSEAVAYAIADNRTTDLSEWDDDALARQLDELRTNGFDLNTLAFDDKQIAKLLDEAEEPDTKPAEDTPPQTLPDQWLVVVTCKDEPDQVAFLEQMQSEGRTCKALVG